MARFEADQPPYNLVVQDIGEELVPVCALKGFGVVVWAPLAGGHLSENIGRPVQLAVISICRELGFPTRSFHPNHEAVVTELQSVVDELGTTPAQVAVSWVLEERMAASASSAPALPRSATRWTPQAGNRRKRYASSLTRCPPSSIATARDGRKTAKQRDLAVLTRVGQC